MGKVRIGITFSTFDLLHAGHILMLQEARAQCDYLICGLHVDPTVERPEKNAPVQSIVERHTQLAAVRYVDEVIPYNVERDLFDILLSRDIDVRIIGDDYRNVEFSGKNICIDRSIEIYHNSRDHEFSSTELRQRIYQAEHSKLNKPDAAEQEEYCLSVKFED